MPTLASAIQSALDANLGLLTDPTAATGRNQLSAALQAALDPYFIHADGSNAPASSTVRGAVKTDVTVADPIVYLKTTTDSLLALKLNLVGGTMTGAIKGGGSPTHVQSNAWFAARNLTNFAEWGHDNTAGYYATLGTEGSSGASFMAFGAEAGTTFDTYRTRGLVGHVLRADLAGGIAWHKVANANADNQALTRIAGLDNLGNFDVNGAIFARSLIETKGSSAAMVFQDRSDPQIAIDGGLVQYWEWYGVAGAARFYSSVAGFDTVNIPQSTGVWNFAARPQYSGTNLPLASEVLGLGGGTLSGGLALSAGNVQVAANYGLLSAAGPYLYASTDANYWQSQSGAGMVIRNLSNVIKGYMYFDASGFGLLDATGNWGVRVNGPTGLSGGLLNGAGGAVFWDIVQARPYSATLDTSYAYAAVQVRELALGGAQTASWIYAPRQSFHWGGRVAMQLALDISGVLTVIDNPGSGYAAMRMGALYINGGTAAADGSASATYHLIPSEWYGPAVYADNWFRPVGATGINWPAYGGHFYRSDLLYLKSSHGNSAVGGFRLYQDYETTLRGGLHFDSSGFGLVNNGGAWFLRANYGGELAGGSLYGAWESVGTFTANGGNLVATGQVYHNTNVPLADATDALVSGLIFG